MLSRCFSSVVHMGTSLLELCIQALRQYNRIPPGQGGIRLSMAYRGIPPSHALESAFDDSPCIAGESSTPDLPCTAGAAAFAAHSLSFRSCRFIIVFALFLILAGTATWDRKGGVGRTASLRFEGPGLALELHQGRSHTSNGRDMGKALGWLQRRPRPHFRRRLEGAGNEQARSKEEENKEPLLCPEDEELFAKALDAGSTSGTPRIAFLFLVRGPLPLARLWEKFLEGQPVEQYSVYIHAAPGFKEDEEQLPEVFRGRQIPSQATEYGTIKIVDGERRLLANALLEPSNTHFILLCESSAPLFAFPFVYEYFTSEPKGFLGHEHNEGYHWIEKFLPLIPKSEWGRGAQWFALRRRHARLVVEDREYYRYFKAVDRELFAHDEHYIQTLLWKKDPEGLIPFSPMSVRWEVGPRYRSFSSHAVKYEFWQITPGLISDLAGPTCAPGDPDRQACHLFARKFSPTAVEPLLQLLPLTKALTSEELARMAADWSSPKTVRVPQAGVPGAGQTYGHYLEAWRGQLSDGGKQRGGERSGEEGSEGSASLVLSQEEEKLFRQALAVEPAGAPRAAFLFLVRDEFLLAPLWAKFFESQQAEQFSMYVYAGWIGYDPSSLPEVFQAATTIIWKDASRNVSIAEGGRHLLATALLDPRNSQFLLLCEDTVPLFSFSFTISYITNTPYSFVDSVPEVWEHWLPSFETLFPPTDWRVGEPWFVLQRPHAALVVSDIEYYRAFRQAGLPDEFEARSYFSTLIDKKDPGSIFNRSLVYTRWPSLGPGPKDPKQIPVMFFFWDVLPGLISDMASPLCPYIPGTRNDTYKGIGIGESSKQPCYLFARRLHGDAITALLRWLPAQVRLV